MRWGWQRKEQQNAPSPQGLDHDARPVRCLRRGKPRATASRARRHRAARGRAARTIRRGTCNVLESDTSYETRRQNHGAPMDIWRLDFSVYNGSGRWLDHLIARFRIDSAWPECTNWDYLKQAGSPNPSSGLARLAIFRRAAATWWRRARRLPRRSSSLFCAATRSRGSRTGPWISISPLLRSRTRARLPRCRRCQRNRTWCSGSRSWTAPTRQISSRISSSSPMAYSERSRRTG